MATESSGLLVGQDEGRAFVNPIGGRMVIKAARAGYSLHENILPPHSPGPRPHIHTIHEEVFYVLGGELTVRVGAQKVVAAAGSFVIIPPGTVHQPSNAGDQPAHVLIFFTPGGMAAFFTEAAERRIPLQEPPTDPQVQAALDDFCRRYSFVFAEFPTSDSHSRS